MIKAMKNQCMKRHCTLIAEMGIPKRLLELLRGLKFKRNTCRPGFILSFSEGYTFVNKSLSVNVKFVSDILINLYS